MNFKALINMDLNCKEKYDYYLSLGYSEKASEVLSTVTYGEEPLHNVLRKMKSSDKIEELHEWLRKRKEKTPEDAFRAPFKRRHGRLLSPTGCGASFVGSASSVYSAGGGSKGMPLVDGYDESDYDWDFIDEVADDMSAGGVPFVQERSLMREATVSAGFGGGGFPADIGFFWKPYPRINMKRSRKRGHRILCPPPHRPSV